MKIIILGAGQVGISTAEILAKEDNDITLVDNVASQVEGLQDRLDIRTIVGSASHPSVLEQAGGPDADLILAVTDQDEVNMAACQVAYTLFRTPKKIARIRSVEYLTHREIFSDDSIPVDVIISPEQLITQHVLHLIEYPGALQVVDFAGGKIKLVGLKAYHGGPWWAANSARFVKTCPLLKPASQLSTVTTGRSSPKGTQLSNPMTKCS